MTPQEATQNDIDKLNAMLRGERSAVETYEQCIEKIEAAHLKQQLAMLKTSHVGRVSKLTGRVAELGGKAETTSGAWGTFAKLVEGGAAVFGDAAAISALEEGEDHGKKTYADLDGLSPTTRQFVQTELVPEQRRTHDALSAIKKGM